MIQTLPFPGDVPVLDAVAPSRPLCEATAMLTAAGLGEPALWLRHFGTLSEGERFRARLARAIALCRRADRLEAGPTTPDRLFRPEAGFTHVADLTSIADSTLIGGRDARFPEDGAPAALLCDAFGESLHRRLAQAVAFNLRKLVSRERLVLIVASHREDIHEDLRPDEVIRLGGAEPVVVRRPREGGAAEPSFASRLRIEQGTLRDYARFAPMHYRAGDRPGFVDKVFVMRDGPGGEVLGVVVYGYPMLELAVRNRATGGRFVRRGARLNREVRVLKRLVIHPDVRGCGLGHRLVRQTLPRVGTPFVECLAAIGAVHPVFEKAGMRAAGVCAAPVEAEAGVAQLRALGTDLLAAEFVDHVRRRPRVRRVVADIVHRWYRATTSEPGRRLAQQTPTTLARTFRQLVGSAPVYYLWSAEDAAPGTED